MSGERPRRGRSDKAWTPAARGISRSGDLHGDRGANELGANEGGLGAADFSFVFGNPGDKPVTGNWDGDGKTEVGLHRESTGFFYWRESLTTGIADGEIFWGDPADRFVSGDWTGNALDTPAVFRPSDAIFYFRHTLTQGVADSQFPFGEGGWLPVAGQMGL